MRERYGKHPACIRAIPEGVPELSRNLPGTATNEVITILLPFLQQGELF
ncbi:hypothetical protein [Daejeonella sp.]